MSDIRRKPRTAAELGIGDVEQVLSEIYMLDTELRADERYFLCPSHADKTPSASVNIKTGWWFCWSCGAGGDLVSLGCSIFKRTRLAVQGLLIPTDPDSIRASIIRATEAHRPKQEVIRTVDKDRVPDPSEYDDGPMDYMYERGFTQETLDLYGIRFVRRARVRTRGKNGNMTIYHAIAIPLYDNTGKDLRAWCYRSTPKSPTYQPRYFYTMGSNTADDLFGHHLCLDNDMAVVTEGPIDSMWITQSGYPSVAVYGSSNTRSYLKLGKLGDFRRVCLFGDRDASGLKFVSEVGGLLSDQTSVMVARYRPSWSGDDPNKLTASQVRYAVEHAIPYFSWLMQAN